MMEDIQQSAKAWMVLQTLAENIQSYNIQNQPSLTDEPSGFTLSIQRCCVKIHFSYSQGQLGWFGRKIRWYQCGYLINLNVFLHQPKFEVAAAIKSIARDSGHPLNPENFLPQT